MDKYKVFDRELNFIKNKEIKEFTIKTLKKIPDYFYTVSSSSTGKYHSKYASGEGGLVRHCRALVGIAVELFDMNHMFTEIEEDMIISALILHDSIKYSLNFTKYTTAIHPKDMYDFIQNNKDLTEDLPKETVDIISNCILKHSGRFNKDYKTGKVILPEPKTKMERFVHMIDYIGSRRFLEFNFDVDIQRK